MRTIAPRTHFAGVYRLYECLVCAKMSFQPLTPPGGSGHARTHALHVPIIACNF